MYKIDGLFCKEKCYSYDMIWYMLWYIFVNCNWVDNRWQYYSTYLHTNNTQNNTMKQNTQNIYKN